MHTARCWLHRERARMQASLLPKTTQHIRRGRQMMRVHEKQQQHCTRSKMWTTKNRLVLVFVFFSISALFSTPEMRMCVCLPWTVRTRATLFHSIKRGLLSCSRALARPRHTVIFVRITWMHFYVVASRIDRFCIGMAVAVAHRCVYHSSICLWVYYISPFAISFIRQFTVHSLSLSVDGLLQLPNLTLNYYCPRKDVKRRK